MALAGKTVLVTGGSGELGRVVVRRFHREGARIFLGVRTPPPRGMFPGGAGARITAVRCDVTSEREVARLYRTIAAKAGRVDILINAAGAFAATGPVAETTVAAWDRMIDVNLRSVFLCSRAFLAQEGIRRYGRIVNIAAQTVFRPSRDRAAYAVAKGAVAAFTTLLGEELRGSGVTANAIAPSILRTAANRKAMPDADASRWVDPEEVADEIVHLCRPGATAVNGAVIPMFGGV